GSPLSHGMTITIQPTPNRSATMPNRCEKKVLLKGICTCPPSAKALNNFSASASVGTPSESENPWKLGFPVQRPSEAITVVSPNRKLACITLSGVAVGQAAAGSGLSL